MNIFLITDNYDDTNEVDPVHEFARIFGTEHPWFWRVHLTALVSLGEIAICLIHFYFLKHTVCIHSSCKELTGVPL